MSKAVKKQSPPENSDKPFILPNIKAEYFVAFFAMVLIILGAVAGESLYPSKSTQTTDSQAGFNGAGQGECTPTGCKCSSGYPDLCKVDHFYSSENNAVTVTTPLNLSLTGSEFSLNCGTEQINLSLKNSAFEDWVPDADTTYISHAINCE